MKASVLSLNAFQNYFYRPTQRREELLKGVEKCLHGRKNYEVGNSSPLFLALMLSDSELAELMELNDSSFPSDTSEENTDFAEERPISDQE